MTMLCSTKRAAGSVFYPCAHSQGNGDTTAPPCRKSRSYARKALRCRHLDAVSRRRRLLDGRRFVPPGPCRQVRQPWCERPPSSAPSVTPIAPPGVVHATVARRQCSEKRSGITPRFERANPVAAHRLHTLDSSQPTRGHRSSIAARKESVCR
jgi:hypothetical protein